jgi:hypothetical protein
LSMFQNEFNLDKKESAALLVASSHLLGKGDEVRDNLKGVLKPSQESFTAEQAQSAIDLLNKIAGVTGSPSHAQTQLVNGVSAILEKIGAPKGKWE